MNHLQWLIDSDYIRPDRFLGAICYGIIVLIIAHFISRGLRTMFKRIIARDTAGHLDRTTFQFLSQLVRFCVYLIAILFYVHIVPQLSHLGTAMLTGVSVVSVVVGLAAQPTLGNLVSGFALLLYRPFKVGDKVQISAPTGLETGIVERLALGYTMLRALDGKRIIVPNSVMASQVVVNLSLKEEIDGDMQGPKQV